jgi:hypothetical protein
VTVKGFGTQDDDTLIHISNHGREPFIVGRDPALPATPFVTYQLTQELHPETGEPSGVLPGGSENPVLLSRPGAGSAPALSEKNTSAGERRSNFLPLVSGAGDGMLSALSDTAGRVDSMLNRFLAPGLQYGVAADNTVGNVTPDEQRVKEDMRAAGLTSTTPPPLRPSEQLVTFPDSAAENFDVAEHFFLRFGISKTDLWNAAEEMLRDGVFMEVSLPASGRQKRMAEWQAPRPVGVKIGSSGGGIHNATLWLNNKSNTALVRAQALAESRNDNDPENSNPFSIVGSFLESVFWGAGASLLGLFDFTQNPGESNADWLLRKGSDWLAPGAGEKQAARAFRMPALTRHPGISPGLRTNSRPVVAENTVRVTMHDGERVFGVHAVYETTTGGKAWRLAVRDDGTPVARSGNAEKVVQIQGGYSDHVRVRMDGSEHEFLFRKKDSPVFVEMDGKDYEVSLPGTDYPRLKADNRPVYYHRPDAQWREVPFPRKNSHLGRSLLENLPDELLTTQPGERVLAEYGPAGRQLFRDSLNNEVYLRIRKPEAGDNIRSRSQDYYVRGRAEGEQIRLLPESGKEAAVIDQPAMVWKNSRWEQTSSAYASLGQSPLPERVLLSQTPAPLVFDSVSHLYVHTDASSGAQRYFIPLKTKSNGADWFAELRPALHAGEFRFHASPENYRHPGASDAKLYPLNTQQVRFFRDEGGNWHYREIVSEVFDSLPDAAMTYRAAAEDFTPEYVVAGYPGVWRGSPLDEMAGLKWVHAGRKHGMNGYVRGTLNDGIFTEETTSQRFRHETSQDVARQDRWYELPGSGDVFVAEAGWLRPLTGDEARERATQLPSADTLNAANYEKVYVIGRDGSQTVEYAPKVNGNSLQQQNGRSTYRYDAVTGGWRATGH